MKSEEIVEELEIDPFMTLSFPPTPTPTPSFLSFSFSFFHFFFVSQEHKVFNEMYVETCKTHSGRNNHESMTICIDMQNEDVCDELVDMDKSRVDPRDTDRR